MTGWHTQIDGEFEQPKGVIAIVVAQKFSDPELIRVKIEEGLARVSPETVWIMRDAERKGHAANYAWQTFRSHGIVPFLAPLVPSWKSNGVERDDGFDYEETRSANRLVYLRRRALTRIDGAYDLRASHRDSEIRGTCERIIVFHDKSSNVTAEWIDYAESRKEFPGDGSHCTAKVYVVERGKTKTKKYRTGRKPD